MKGKFMNTHLVSILDFDGGNYGPGDMLGENYEIIIIVC